MQWGRRRRRAGQGRTRHDAWLPTEHCLTSSIRFCERLGCDALGWRERITLDLHVSAAAHGITIGNKRINASLRPPQREAGILFCRRMPAPVSDVARPCGGRRGGANDDMSRQ